MHYDRCSPDGTLNFVTKELIVGGLYHPAAFSALEIQSERYKIRKITPPNPSANCSTVDDEEAGDDSDEEAPELVIVSSKFITQGLTIKLSLQDSHETSVQSTVKRQLAKLDQQRA